MPGGNTAVWTVDSEGCRPARTLPGAAAFAASDVDSGIVTVVLASLSQSLYRNRWRAPVFLLSTSICCRCHAAPKPRSTCTTS